MPLHQTLKPYFNQTVTIAPLSSRDGYGKPTYGTAASYKAKIEMATEIIRMDNGEDVKSTRKIFLDSTDTSITVHDKLTLPSAFPPVNPKIFAVRAVLDREGLHHIVLVTE